jgi:hypothetical protein
LFDDAAMVLEEIEAEEKTRDEVLGARVNLYMAAKKWDRAAAVAGHLVKVDPENEAWWINLAYSVRRSEGVEKAEEGASVHPKIAMIAFNLPCYAKRHRQDRGGKRARWSTEERRVFALIVITASSFLLSAPRPSRKLELTDAFL